MGSYSAKEAVQMPVTAVAEAATAPVTAAVPDDFGAEDGTAVSNAETVFAEIDRALGRNKPPALEYVFVEPYSSIPLLFGMAVSPNSFGHALVRYTLPSGEQKIMNICGGGAYASIVNFMEPIEYFFSTSFRGKGNGEQRGLYNRAMVSVRVEELPPENILAMHQYYTEVQGLSAAKQAKFDIAFGPIWNFCNNFLPSFARFRESGNCARWTSKGLEHAGVVTRVSMWPKSIWINIWENAARDGRTAAGSAANVNVVSYRRIKHAKLSYGLDLEPLKAVGPLQTLRSVLYWNLERFANVIVEVPPGSTAATVRVQHNPEKQNPLRNATVNNKYFIWTSVVVTGGFLLRQNHRVMTRLRNWRLRLTTKVLARNPLKSTAAKFFLR